MPNTFFGLMIGKSGLYAYQAAQNTTAHNAANVDTEGYCRQLVNRSASQALSVASNYGMQGTGVNVDSITQERNVYFDLKYRSNAAILANYETKSYYLDSLQAYISEVNSGGTTAAFDDIFTTLSSLEGNADDRTLRTELTENSKTFTDYIGNMYDRLSSLQKEANDQIKQTASEINSYAQQISILNRQINAAEVTGKNANDLRDSRNLLIDKLSTLANVTVSETPMGDGIGANYYTVRLNGATLVDTYNYSTLKVDATAPKVNQNTADGMYQLTWQPSGQDFNCYSPTLGGRMQALFEFRDGNNKSNFTGTAASITAGSQTVTVTGSNVNKMSDLNIPERDGTITVGGKEYTYDYFEVDVDADGNYTYTFQLKDKLVNTATNQDVKIGRAIDYKGVPYYMEKVNEFIRTFSECFNNQHKQGTDLQENPGLDYFVATDKVTGNEYTFSSAEPGSHFSSKDDGMNKSYYSMTGSNYTVNDKILKDVELVAFAQGGYDDVTGEWINGIVANGTGDATNLKELLELGSDEDMFRQGTPDMFLQSLTGDVGVDAKAALNFAANQENVLALVKNQRMSVSGVDSDEEGTNIVKFQGAYNLCSKIISVMNEMYDKLINQTGV